MIFNTDNKEQISYKSFDDIFKKTSPLNNSYQKNSIDSKANCFFQNDHNNNKKTLEGNEKNIKNNINTFFDKKALKSINLTIQKNLYNSTTSLSLLHSVNKDTTPKTSNKNGLKNKNYSISDSKISVLKILQSECVNNLLSKSEKNFKGITFNSNVNLISSVKKQKKLKSYCKNLTANQSIKSSKLNCHIPALLPPVKPPRKYHYTNIKQMTTQSSTITIPVSNFSSLRLPQQQQPIRIPQPPPQKLQNQTICNKPKAIYQHHGSASSSTLNCVPLNNKKFTTTFHSNLNDGLTMTSLNYCHSQSKHVPQSSVTQPTLHSTKINSSASDYNVGINEYSNNNLTSGNHSTFFMPTSHPKPIRHYTSAPVLPLNHPLNNHSQKNLVSFVHTSQNSYDSNSIIRQQQRVQNLNTSLTNKTNFLLNNNLFDIACHQQRQIDANSVELREKRQLISSTIATAASTSEKEELVNGTGLASIAVIDQVRSIKNHIALDEQELAHLSSIQRQAQNLNAHNQVQRKELGALEATYEQNDTQLRMAVEKVDTLKKKLDLLYQRRALAASAAVAQQRKINEESVLISNCFNNNENQQPNNFNKFTAQQNYLNYDQLNLKLESKSTMFNSSTQKDDLKKNIFNEITFNSINKNSSPLSLKQNCENFSPYQYGEAHRFLAYGKPDQVSLRSDSLTAIKRRSWAQAQSDDNAQDNIWRYLVEEQRKGKTHVSFADIMAAKNTQMFKTIDKVTSEIENKQFETNQTKESVLLKQKIEKNNKKTLLKSETKTSTTLSSNRNLENISETKDNLTEENLKTSNVSATEEESQSIISNNKQYNQMFKNSVFCENNVTKNFEIVKEEKNYDFHTNFESDIKDNKRDDDEFRNESGESVNSDTSNTTTIEPDELEIHSNASSSCETELENSKPVISEEEKFEIVNEEDKKKSSFYDSSSETTLCEEHNNNATINLIKEVPSSINDIVIEEINTESLNYSLIEEYEDEGFDVMGEALDVNLEIDHGEASSTTTDEISSTISVGDEPIFDEKSLKSNQMSKSILRSSISTQHKRHVVFDETVLFLDMAYEGEYSTLVELASKIADISVANSDGITALHNAICAGNQDIVKFLIDNHANVNALDLDGWSPLHCAASCNNLIMLQQLIENGACVFAMTLSKSETAIDLIDENQEEFFETGVSYLELVDNCMGVVNDKKVYAAFSYSTSQSDELSFEKGDELCVIERYDNFEEDKEKWNEDVEFDNNCYWWLCEHTKSEKLGQRGLVPRNYLALYPPWPYQKQYDCKTIKLPNALSKPTALQRYRRQKKQRERENEWTYLQWYNISAAAKATVTTSA